MKADALFRVLEYFRTNVNKEIRVHQVSMFLMACIDDGITMTEIGDKLDAPQGNISRNANMLAYKYGLVSLIPDPQEPRRLGLYLTGRGREVKKIFEAMG